MTVSICLNADLGEMPGADGRALDAAMLGVVTRCNIACGGHAGDAEIMRETVRTAKINGVQIGAHPSYPDLSNFGRRSIQIAPTELRVSLTAQVRLLAGIAASEGAEVVHLKAHGALYNDAARDEGLARLLAHIAQEAELAELVGPPGSQLEQAAGAAGLRFVAEGFADRSYEADGSLTPRHISGAVIEAPDEVLAQAVTLAMQGAVTARGGARIDLRIQTLCLHGDTPGAAAHARAIRTGLEQAGIAVQR
ncbi:5-oxoprolinase subunit PxpA [Hyphomonas sp.]|uniref:5-oxoprolinase subunit PxpA n=1 Tax=Hyphomonas sp. TaxID=87 RepID=UPI00391B5FEA